MDRRRGRCRLAVLVAAALCLVASHQGICLAAARRLHAAEEAVLDVAAAEAEAPEASSWPGGEEAALGEAKWLPMSMPMPMQIPMPMQMPMPMPAASALASGLRFPPVVFPLGGVGGGGASMPWLPLPGAPHVFSVPAAAAGGNGGGGGGNGGGFPALVPPYVGATRQEQLSLWASLFNPLQVRPRLPISLGGSGGDTTAGPGGVEHGGGVPAAIAGGVKQAIGGGDGGAAVDVPGASAVQVAGPKWGVVLGNIDQRN